MKKKSMTDNYSPQGKGSNSTDNRKDGAIDSTLKTVPTIFAMKIDREPVAKGMAKNHKKAPKRRTVKSEARRIIGKEEAGQIRNMSAAPKRKPTKPKKRIGTVGGYKYLTRKRNVQ